MLLSLSLPLAQEENSTLHHLPPLNPPHYLSLPLKQIQISLSLKENQIDYNTIFYLLLSEFERSSDVNKCLGGSGKSLQK